MEGLIEELRIFSKERDWGQFHNPKNLAMSLGIESAELMGIFQWMTGEESRNLSEEDLERLKYEIADILIYLVNLADKFGIDIMEAAKEKIEKNRVKYPIERYHGRWK